MSTNTANAAAPPARGGARGGSDAMGGRERAVSDRGVCRSEWIKFRSVPSLPLALVAAFGVAVFFGVLFSWFAGSADGPAPGGPGAAPSDPVTLALSGFNLAVLIIGVLGVLIVTSDYGSGVIRATFSAVPSRLPVLRAKFVVFAVIAFPVMAIAALAAFLAGGAVYGGDAAVPSLAEGDVLRAVFGMAAYTTSAGLLGLAFGFLLRSSAAAIGVLIALLLVAPGLVGLLPGSVGDAVTKVLPSNAATALTSVSRRDDLLGPGNGAVVLALWVAVLIALAGFALRRRDV